MNHTNPGTDPVAWLEAVIDIGRSAADRILEIYGSDFDVEDKEDRSPLTAADMAAHRTICAGLQSLTPDIPILSEESSGIPFSERRGWSRYWLVDPLDGTREFIKRNGEFTVNIALIEDHEPILGLVHVPAKDTCYFASRGRGAFRQAGGADPVAIRTRETKRGRYTVAGSRSHGSGEQQRFFAALGEDVEIIAIGSALKFCLVAEGAVDIYPRFGPTSEWDTAAAQCVVEEAGGLVTDMNFAPLRYNTKESLLNPHFLVIADRGYDWAPFLAA